MEYPIAQTQTQPQEELYQLESLFQIARENWVTWTTPLAVFLFTLFVGWFARRLLYGALKKWASKTNTELDDLVIRATHGPFMLWVLMLALFLAAQTSQLPASATSFVSRALLALWIISLTLVAAKLSGSLIQHFSSALSGTLPMTSLTQNVASLVITILGLLVLLNTLGVSITPILTALGVGGLAVALALQDTLSNLFAGFYISLAGQVRSGDFVKLDSGEEGYISDITWRSTAIRTLPNNMVFVPNAKLAQAIVTNFHLPEPRMSLLIRVSVSYDSNPRHVERVLIEEAVRGAKDIPGLLAEPAPFVRFIPGYGDSSIDFTLICQVKEFVDQYFAQHELRMRIFERFREEGIEIPFPIRTIHLKNQDAELVGGMAGKRN